MIAQSGERGPSRVVVHRFESDSSHQEGAFADLLATDIGLRAGCNGGSNPPLPMSRQARKKDRVCFPRGKLHTLESASWKHDRRWIDSISSVV